MEKPTIFLQHKANGDVYRVIELKPDGVELKNLSSGKGGLFPSVLAKETLGLPVKLNLLCEYKPEVAKLIEELQLSVI
jgi:hypothetical protein